MITLANCPKNNSTKCDSFFFKNNLVKLYLYYTTFIGTWKCQFGLALMAPLKSYPYFIGLNEL